MMRKIAIGLAAATIAVGGSTLSASARATLTTACKYFADLTPDQRERLREIVREVYPELTTRQHQRIRGIMHEHFGQPGPFERERRGAYGRRWVEIDPGGSTGRAAYAHNVPMRTGPFAPAPLLRLRDIVRFLRLRFTGMPRRQARAVIGDRWDDRFVALDALEGALQRPEWQHDWAAHAADPAFRCRRTPISVAPVRTVTRRIAGG